MNPSPSKESTSGSLQRPSLIAGLKTSPNRGPGSHSLPWKIEDAALRPVPAFYPPMNPQCTVFVADASPSVVAARISECLRKRSIAVEYDEESHTASCLTMDRVQFTIHLYRGKRSSKAPLTEQEMLEKKPDFSHGIIVECMRTRGDTISFHHTCRGICSAALGHSDGKDWRLPLRTSVLESRRLTADEERPNKRARLSIAASGNSADSEAAHQQSLERSLVLLKKDRICAQQLGMESLVALTDYYTVGVEQAMQASLAVLGAPIVEGLEEIHTWIVSLIQDRTMPGEDQVEVAVNLDESDQVELSVVDISTNSTPVASTMEDVHHGGVLRARALRAMCNALALVSQHQPELLKSILSAQSPHMVEEPMLCALVDDLAGATRPPGVVEGTRLASAHEAALATACLRILAEHSEAALKSLSPEDSSEKSKALRALEKGRAAGQASHQWLEQESEKALFALTQNVRTC